MRVFTGLLICTLLTSLSGFAQFQEPLDFIEKSKLKTAVVGSYPTEVWEYQWMVEIWSVYQQRRISYTSFGAPEEETIIGKGGDSKTIYSYNTDEQLVEKLIQKKQDGNWINERRERMEYDDDGFMSQSLLEAWINQEWVLETGYQYSSDTDQEGILIVIGKIWSREDSDWITSTRTSYSFDTDKRITEAINEGWENGAWKFIGKLGYVYGENNSLILTFYSFVADEWLPTQRSADEFDSHGNIVLHTNEIYSGGEWLMWNGSQYTLTYDGENLIERITKITSLTAPGVWKNSYKEEFKAFASLSTKPRVIYEASISHYPNPAGEYISLNIYNLNNKQLEINLLDLAGKVLKTQEIFVPVTNYEYVLQLIGLSPGVYIIQAREKSGKLIQSMRVIHEE